ncbi:peptide-methionine (S)-S-oxide reductase MsrA [Pelagibacteraceae bacterium]|nr:peptide-methionine (S)-S-oxide reductase MsrA [Pelagibacteraceae bacterium]
MKIAYFSLGCFWSPQLEFEKIKGVKKAEVGYCGGNDPNTTYEKVCSGSTNHAETIKVEFDENEISYEELVRFFFKIHDPTQLNRQGPDIGTQYRSEIFYKDESQKKIAEKIKEEFNKKFNGKVVTNISEEKLYQPAEEYHQYYLKRKGIL